MAQDRISVMALRFAESKGQDQEAFNEVYRINFHYIDWKASEKAEEVKTDRLLFQEALEEALWRAARDYNGDIPFKAWFSVYARHAIRDVICKEKQTSRIVLMDDLQDTISVYDPIQYFLEENETKEKLADFYKASEPKGKIIKMLYLGFSNQEIAKSIGASRYDAKTRKKVQRAREKFREYLQNAS